MTSSQEGERSKFIRQSKCEPERLQDIATHAYMGGLIVRPLEVEIVFSWYTFPRFMCDKQCVTSRNKFQSQSEGM